jgi:hypothetical protein
MSRSNQRHAIARDAPARGVVGPHPSSATDGASPARESTRSRPSATPPTGDAGPAWCGATVAGAAAPGDPPGGAARGRERPTCAECGLRPPARVRAATAAFPGTVPGREGWCARCRDAAATRKSKAAPAHRAARNARHRAAREALAIVEGYGGPERAKRVLQWYRSGALAPAGLAPPGGELAACVARWTRRGA